MNSAPFVGGGEISMLETAETMRDLHYEMQFAVPSEGEYAVRLREQGFHVHVLGVRSPNMHRWPNPFKTVRKLRQILRAGEFDLLHCNSFPYLLPAVLATRACGAPLVLHVRDMIPHTWFRFHHNWLIKRVDAIVCITKKVAEAFGHLSNVHVVSNGIRPEQYEKSNGQLRRLLGVTPEAFLVGIVGYLLPRKGHEEFVEAGLRLLERYPCMKFVVIGDDPFPKKEFGKKLRDRIKAANRETNFAFTGKMQDLSGVYADLNVLAMPSWEEPFGRVAVEAMAAGVPVVACNAGGVPEIIDNQSTGLLVPPRSVDALAGAIARFHDDEPLARGVRENAKALVRKKFHIQYTAARIAEIYETVLGKQA